MVSWTKKAEEDLRKIHSYISESNSGAANSLLEEIIDAADILKENPRIGRMIPEFMLDDCIREIIHKKKYRIMYRIDDKDIQILQVLHSSQRL